MIEILDPTTAAATRPLVRAPRPSSLAGTRVALVENTKVNSDRLLQKLGDLLVAEYGARETRLWRKRHASTAVDEALVEEVRRTADVAVTGIGD